MATAGLAATATLYSFDADFAKVMGIVVGANVGQSGRAGLAICALRQEGNNPSRLGHREGHPFRNRQC